MLYLLYFTNKASIYSIDRFSWNVPNCKNEKLDPNLEKNIRMKNIFFFHLLNIHKH